LRREKTSADAVYRWNAALNRWTECHAVLLTPLWPAKPDFHAASPSEWQLAWQREAVIRPLAHV